MRSKFPRPALAPFALSLVILLASASSAQTAPDESKEPASIAGRVTRAGRPAAEAEVVLVPIEWSPQRKPSAKAKTGEDGRYRMEGVPPGRYLLSAVSPGFFAADAPAGEWMPGKVINLAPGDELRDMDFALARGGVVTGRVLDPEGKPAVEEYVTLLPADERERKAATHNPLIYQTDDRGVYRAWGVRPGRYFVYAGRSKENNYARGENDSGGFYPQTFHPSVSEEAQAKVVEVTGGGAAEDVDITLGKMRRTYKASGRVVDEDGRPLRGISVEVGSLSNEGGRQTVGNVSAAGPSDERGEFRAEGLMPGRWGVWGTDGEPFSGKQGTSYGEVATFEVTDRDVSGLEVKMHRGATVSGVVTIEGTSDPAVLARRSELKLWVQVSTPQDTAAPPTWARFGLKPDGTFQVTGMRPGRARFNLDWPQPKGFSLHPHSVRREGVEMPDGVEVRKGEQVKDVQVAFSYGTSVLRGQVQFGGGGPRAVLRLVAEVRRAGTNFIMGRGVVDELGRFVIESLSAGEYDLHLVEYAQPEAPAEKRRLVKQNVSVPEGGESKVTIAYDAGPAPKENEQ